MNTRHKFVYRVLLVDDLQGVTERAKMLTGVGVDIEVIRTVDEVLQQVFNVKDVAQASIEDYRPHEFDIVLLDFELEPPDQLGQGQHPLGGMTLFPLFINSFRTDKKGRCVVVNYSDKLQKTSRLQTLKCLMEIGHSMQHGRTLKIQQKGFKDFNLVPLIEERATSILLALPRTVLTEIKMAAKEANSLQELLDEKELATLGGWMGCRTTLGALRPDVGRPVFVSSVSSKEHVSTRKISHKEEMDFRNWLLKLQQSASWCHTIQKLYKSPEINHPAHVVGFEVEADFWKQRIRTDVHKGIAEVRTGTQNIVVPLRMAERLIETKWSDGLSRCGVWHSFFRLCLNDDPLHRSGLSGYQKGYFLEDIGKLANLKIQASFTNDFANSKKSLYVYAPQPTLVEMVSIIAAQVNTKNVMVELSPEKHWVQFVFKNPIDITPDFLDRLAAYEIWEILPSLQEWGDLFAVDLSGTAWCMAPGGKVGSLWRGVWKPAKNVFALRLPLEKVTEGAKG